MAAAVARVQEMASADRIVTLESDVKRVFTDVGEIKGSVKELDSKVQALDIHVQVVDTRVQELDGKDQVLDRKVDHLEEKVDGVIIDLHSFKTEVAKEFGALRELLRIQI